MQTHLKCEIAMKLTQPDGEEFFEAQMKWSKLPYEAVLDLQKGMLGQVTALVKLGDQRAAEIKAGNAGSPSA